MEYFFCPEKILVHEIYFAQPGFRPRHAARGQNICQKGLGCGEIAYGYQQVAFYALEFLRVGRVLFELFVARGDRAYVVLRVDGFFDRFQRFLFFDQFVEPRFQNARSDRLQQVIVGLGFRRAHEHIHGFFCGDHHPDGGITDVFFVSGLFQNLLPVLPVPEVVVADHDVIFFRCQQRKGFSRVGGVIRVGYAHALEEAPQHGAHTLKIINYQRVRLFQ